MVLPALPAIGKAITSAGIFETARRSIGRVIPRARGAVASLSQNARAVLGLGAGTAGGFGLSSIMDSLGIQDQRARFLTAAAVIVGGIVALGQLFNVDLEL